jgi:long-chain acyl-CoA synthetase
MPDPGTIPELLEATVSQAGERDAFGRLVAGVISWKTWQDVHADVLKAIACLHEWGIGRGDRVVQFAPNSYEWIITDLAILSLGAVHVPLHATLPASQAADLLAMSDAKLLVLDDDSTNISNEITIVTHAKLFAEIETDRRVSMLAAQVKPEDLATILFTSGTTGLPRGVILSHANLVSNTIATVEAVSSPYEELRFCFLPLSHIYARTCDLYAWIYRGSRIVLAHSRDTIMRDCQIAQPTVINGVPYFYQKVVQTLHAEGKSKQPGALLQLLGGELKLCFCGGAAVAPEVEKLFSDQGLPLLSGYGLTEASPVISATRKENYAPGSVGRPLRDVEVRLAADGEIQVRGPNVMLGYWQDQAATNEAIVDGWLHTGDLGAFDDHGNLRIVGRRKEILALSTGKKVCPVSVEHRLSGSPYVEAVCVVGDGRSHLAALIVPNPLTLKKFIKENHLWVWSKHKAVTHPKVRELFRSEIDRLLVDAAREEHVGPFTILTRNFSLEAGEVTAKFSLRRDVIARNFAREIAEMY